MKTPQIGGPGEVGKHQQIGHRVAREPQRVAPGESYGGRVDKAGTYSPKSGHGSRLIPENYAHLYRKVVRGTDGASLAGDIKSALAGPGNPKLTPLNADNFPEF